MTEHSVKLVTREILDALNSAGRDFSAHSIFSPSGSSMWAYCSGSLIPNLFAQDTAGEDAAYGTVAHGVAEQWLKSGERPYHLLDTVERVIEGEQVFEITIDAEMMDYVQEYVDWCIYLPGQHFVEVRVDHSDLTPLDGQGGTSDHAACEPGLLTITDLKMGKGVQVFAKNNTQAIIYAYGFFKKYDDLYDFQRIKIRIAQPRLNHFDEWEITREELLQWAAWIKQRAFMAWCKDAERTPGEKQCRFCKIKNDCAARAVWLERQIDDVFEDQDTAVSEADMKSLMQRLDDGTFELRPVSIGMLTVEQKVKLSRYRKIVEDFFSSIQADLEERALRGEKVPGKKVVEGRSNRVFTNVNEATEHLELLGLDYDVIRPRGMIGITETETQLRKLGYKGKHLDRLLESVVRKPAGKPTVVDEDDPRPAIVDSISSVFDNLDEEL